MQILLIWLMTAVAAVQSPSVNQRLTRSESLLVRAVVDGATINVASVGRVQLLGIDAPKGSQPFAREARERLTALVLRRWVRLELEGLEGTSGTHRAYVVRDDNLFVNAVLVREGLARVGARRGLVRLGELERAETEARAARRGIWASAPAGAATGYTQRSTDARSPSISLWTTRKTRPKGPLPKT